MLTYTKLVTKPEKVLRFTSLTKEQFENIASSIAPLWEIAEVKRLSRNVNWNIKMCRVIV